MNVGHSWSTGGNSVPEEDRLTLVVSSFLESTKGG